jgi:hypothetical protein
MGKTAPGAIRSRMPSYYNMNMRAKWAAKNIKEYTKSIAEDQEILRVIDGYFSDELLMIRPTIEKSGARCIVKLECLSLEESLTSSKKNLERKLQKVVPGCKLELEPMSTPVKMLHQIIRDCAALIYKNPKGNIVNVIKGVLNRAMRSGRGILRGADIICNGRIRGANISGGVRHCVGSVPYATLDACVVQRVVHMNLPFGVMSLKVTVNVKTGGIKRER